MNEISDMILFDKTLALSQSWQPHQLLQRQQDAIRNSSAMLCNNVANMERALKVHRLFKTRLDITLLSQVLRNILDPGFS